MSDVEMVNGYIPGAIGRVAELHGTYYAEHWSFGCFFEAKVATELSEFLERYDKQRDGFWSVSLDSRLEGSISIDGVSLTIARLGPDSLTVAVIPETHRRTTLGLRKVGDPVNLEADILGKMVARLLGKTAPGGLTMDKLREAGW